MFTTFLRCRVDHRNCTDPSILAAKLGNADIEFAGPRTPLALLNAIRSRCTIIAVKYDLPTWHNNCVGLCRDEADEWRNVRIVRRHHQMISWIVAHLIGSFVIGAGRGWWEWDLVRLR